MENQELRTKIDGLKGTLVQVMDEGFDIAKSFLSIKLEEYLAGGRTSAGNTSSKSNRAVSSESDDIEAEVKPARASASKKSVLAKSRRQ